MSIDEKNWVNSQTTLKVANELDWPPFDFAEDGVPMGYSIDLIRQQGAMPAGFAIALDRQERAADSHQSALQQVSDRHSIPVLSIATLTDLVNLLITDPEQAGTLTAIQKYRDEYGA